MQGEHTSPALLTAGLTAQQVRQLKSFFCRQIYEIVATLKGSRVRVAVTACMYFQRFYVRRTFLDHDPRFVAPACIYLAGKAEENSQHSKSIMMAVLRNKHELIGTIDTKTLLEFEMIVVQELDFNLLVFSPHHTLKQYLIDIKRHSAIQKRAFEEVVDEQKQPVLNEVCLQIDCSQWLEEVDYDDEGVYHAVQLLMELKQQPKLDVPETLRLLEVLKCTEGAT